MEANSVSKLPKFVLYQIITNFGIPGKIDCFEFANCSNNDTFFQICILKYLEVIGIGLIREPNFAKYQY